jgi:hypothetical protein
VLVPDYGIFREVALQTLSYGDLEYSVNGGAFVSAAGAIDAGGGWRRIDITTAVMDATTFRPVQEANTLSLRAAAGAGAITLIGSWSLSAGEVSFTTTSAHSLNVGDKVVIAGAPAGTTSGTNVNGTYTVTAVDSALIFRVPTLATGTDSASGGSGTLAYSLTGTIDAQLSVRNIIQAIAVV